MNGPSSKEGRVTRKLSGWWEGLGRTHKALATIILAATAIAGVTAAFTAESHELFAIPARVDSLEAHDRRQEASAQLLQRALDAKVDTVRDEIREVRDILIEMNCEQRGLSPAQCREERLRFYR